jgi:hypothetical protein
MEEFLLRLPTGLMVFTFKKCIKRMHGDVMCVCVRACPHVSTPELLYSFLLHFVRWNRHRTKLLAECCVVHVGLVQTELTPWSGVCLHC